MSAPSSRAQSPTAEVVAASAAGEASTTALNPSANGQATTIGNLAVSPSSSKDPRSALDALMADENESSAAQAQGSGWGWMSWGASLVGNAIKAVEQVDVSTIRSTAEKLGSTVGRATTDGLDKVYKTLDPDFATDEIRMREEDSKAQRSPASDGTENVSPRSDTSLEPRALGHIKHGASAASEAVFQTLDIASDLLGSAVLGGYRIVSSESAKIGQRVEEFTKDAKTRQMVEASGGYAKDVASHSLGALENIGRKAMDVFNDNNKSQMRTTNIDIKKSSVKTAPTFKSLFEDNAGSAHLSALTLLSTESAHKLDRIRAKDLSVDSANEIKEQAVALDKLFDIEELLEMLEEEGETDCLAEDTAVSELINTLKTLELSKHSSTLQIKKIRTLVQSLQKQIKEIEKTPLSNVPSTKTNTDDEELDESNDEFERETAANNWKTAQETMHAITQKSLADVSEVACELLLRISEVFLLRIAEEGDTEDEKETSKKLSPIELTESLRTVVYTLLKEINYLGVVSVASLDEQKVRYSRWASKQHILLDESNLVNDMKRNEMRIFEDVGSALSYVQEAMAANRSILKLMQVITVTHPSQAMKTPTYESSVSAKAVETTKVVESTKDTETIGEEKEKEKKEGEDHETVEEKTEVEGEEEEKEVFEDAQEEMNETAKEREKTKKTPKKNVKTRRKK